jgi:hypothetical protein
MTYNIKDFKAIAPELVTKLAGLNIHTTDDFMKLVKDPKGLTALTLKAGVEPTTMDRLFKITQLTKVDGVKLPHAELLYHSGVDSVEKLVTEKPEMLLTRLTEVNTAQKLATPLPTLVEVQKWVKVVPVPEMANTR